MYSCGVVSVAVEPVVPKWYLLGSPVLNLDSRSVVDITAIRYHVLLVSARMLQNNYTIFAVSKRNVTNWFSLVGFHIQMYFERRTLYFDSIHSYKRHNILM